MKKFWVIFFTILNIFYINTNNYINKECIVFKLLSSNLNSSIQNLYAYLNESIYEYSLEYMDYDNTIIFEKDEYDICTVVNIVKV